MGKVSMKSGDWLGKKGYFFVFWVGSVENEIVEFVNRYR